MKRQLVIEFPLPPRELSANPTRAGSWRKKSTAVSKYKTICSIMAKYEIRSIPIGDLPIPAKAVLHLRFYYGPTPGEPGLYRARDEANALYSFKAGQDALVMAGLLKDDSAKHLKMGETVLYTTAKDHKGRACVEATLEWEDGLDG